MTALLLLAAFAFIVGGAVIFTNAVEWLGHRLELGGGAVGALLAAVGTALPESTIPLVALLIGPDTEERVQIAIGAIIGAPFMLATIAMLLVSGSAFAFGGRRDTGRRVEPHVESTRRDLIFFLVLFPLAIGIGLLGLGASIQIALAVALVAVYGVYAYLTVKGGGEASGEDELKPLYFDRSKEDPPARWQIGLQFAVGLAAIVGGAELFVTQVESVAHSLGVSVLVLSLILAPLATELPEKANSILWVRAGKDDLALGNITGAMVFQSSVPVAFGLLLTDWALQEYAVAAGVAAVLGGMLALVALARRSFGPLASLGWSGLFAAFVLFVVVA